MNIHFFYRNYEKIALTVVLAIFSFALLWLVNLTYEAEKTRSTGITIIANKAKYEPVPKSFYDFEGILARSQMWLPSTKRNLNKDDEFYIVTYTDFMKPFKMARSPSSKSEGKLIPFEYFKLGYSPITKEKISLAKETPDETSDIDKDKIPDLIEKQAGLDPANPSDAYLDMDKDTFSNVQEYIYFKNASSINNKAKHPPIIKRIVIMNIKKEKIPLVVKKVIRRGSDIRDWDIQINLTNYKYGPKTMFLKIDSTIETSNTEYKITGIEDRVFERLEPALRTVVSYDDSIVILKNAEGEEIRAEINKPVYGHKKIVTVKDLFTGESYNLSLNDTIILGNGSIGIEIYVLTVIKSGKDIEDSSLMFSDNKKDVYTVKSTTDYVPPKKEEEKQNETQQYIGTYD